jgi:hypothetical protein
VKYRGHCSIQQKGRTTIMGRKHEEEGEADGEREHEKKEEGLEESEEEEEEEEQEEEAKEKKKGRKQIKMTTTMISYSPGSAVPVSSQ